jgi:hypothetical protein
MEPTGRVLDGDLSLVAPAPGSLGERLERSQGNTYTMRDMSSNREAWE